VLRCKQYVIVPTNQAAAEETQKSANAAVSVGFTDAGSTKLANDAAVVVHADRRCDGGQRRDVRP
jgi:hypothetical protein